MKNIAHTNTVHVHYDHRSWIIGIQHSTCVQKQKMQKVLPQNERLSVIDCYNDILHETQTTIAKWFSFDSVLLQSEKRHFTYCILGTATAELWSCCEQREFSGVEDCGRYGLPWEDSTVEKYSLDFTAAVTSINGNVDARSHGTLFFPVYAVTSYFVILSSICNN